MIEFDKLIQYGNKYFSQLSNFLKERYAMNISMWANQGPSHPVIKLGIIGQGESGKTCMLNAVRRTVLNQSLGDKLYYGALSATEMKILIDELAKAESALAKGSLGMTYVANEYSHAINEGAKTVLSFIYYDAIGQLLKHVDIKGDELRRHVEFQKRMSIADVLWAVIPLYKTTKGCSISSTELQVIMSYVKDAVDERPENRKVSIGILLTKADIAGTSESANTKTILDNIASEVVKKFKPLIQYDDRVWSSCVFPVSSFGFDNVVEREIQLTTTKEAVQQLVLNENNNLEPWNIHKLILWSLICGLSQPRPRTEDEESEAKRLASILNPIMNQTSGPVLVVKEVR